ncbi:hypothetical protein [Halosolutus gelatinilyticus]|uniref:hypothetical protein n=1 Tax=Halosolutus gelatinilyticus TaxID=2931975 RepID=UPI001FF4F96E|nr:hypothetical protein [Halosolutus gelatinilyticus]
MTSTRVRLALTGLRLGAIALVVSGFVGWATGDAASFSLDSPFTIAFLAGVGCAIASIYLGIFLTNRDET